MNLQYKPGANRRTLRTCEPGRITHAGPHAPAATTQHSRSTTARAEAVAAPEVERLLRAARGGGAGAQGGEQSGGVRLGAVLPHGGALVGHLVRAIPRGRLLGRGGFWKGGRRLALLLLPDEAADVGEAQEVVEQPAGAEEGVLREVVQEVREPHAPALDQLRVEAVEPEGRERGAEELRAHGGHLHEGPCGGGRPVVEVHEVVVEVAEVAVALREQERLPAVERDLHHVLGVPLAL
eukprot:CAMPEP_0180238698 /NCGR_PEP_ID=MMETSP0987-20121128/31088_1 /TAXON_ID=697907 /ORGANISM="non described non described, Strain CCMP2293" /LENGTH=236 /DNA_ID=CAMNT_0022205281 /DNA_START=49 /DNA_END=757 /DNA_ORIENTATION=-